MEIIEEVVRLFNNPKKTNKGYLVSCVYHDDSQPSLHISQDGNRVLVKCFAGCPTEAILDFINGKGINNFKRLSSDTLNSILGQEKKKPVLEFDSSYDYCDESGKLLYQVLKYYEVHEDGKRKKTFKYRRPSTKDEYDDYGVEWVYSLEGIRKVPYNLKQVLDQENKMILLVEGEKDSLNVIKKGFIGTCFPFGGGDNKWKSEYAQYFHGKDLVLIPDNDKPGWDLCLDIALGVKDIVNNLYFVPLPVKEPKEDITDYFEKYKGSAYSLMELVTNSNPIHNYDNSYIRELINFDLQKTIDSDVNVVYPNEVQSIMEEQTVDTRYEDFIAELDKHESSLTFELCDICFGTGFPLMIDNEGIQRVLTKNSGDGGFIFETCPKCKPQMYGQNKSSDFQDLRQEDANF